MVRLILLIVIILFLAWILRPFLKTKGSDKAKNTVERLLDTDRSNFSQKNIALIISAVILLVSVVWILPKFGINILGLLQKIIPQKTWPITERYI